MTRRIAVSVALLVAVAIFFAGWAYAGPASATGDRGCDASDYPGGIGKHPGGVCHLTTTTAKATTTTVKPTTTTTKKVTTTTTAKATAKASTTTTKKVTTTTTAKATAKASTTATSKASSTTSTSAKNKKTTAKSKLALGALAAAFVDPGSGGPAGGSGGTGGSVGGSDDPTGAAGENVDAAAVNATGAGPQLLDYFLNPVAILLLLAYGISFTLYRTKRMPVTTHRKVWNVLLPVTYLIFGLVGLALALGIIRDPPLEFPDWLLVWHVETGIAICFISLFHFGWHLRHYLAVATGKREAGREPAAARPRAGRRQADRLRAPRTEAERVLAFEKRQAARVHAGEVEGPRPEPRLSDAERWLREVSRGMPRRGSLLGDPLAD